MQAIDGWGVHCIGDVQAVASRMECVGENVWCWVGSRIQVTVLGGGASHGHTPDIGCVKAKQIVQPLLHRITRGIADWLHK